MGNSETVPKGICKRCQAELEYFWLDFLKRWEGRCSACSEKNILAKKQENQAKEYFERQQKINALIEDSRIKKRFRDCTFENYVIKNEKQRKIHEYCKKFSDNFADHLSTGTWILMHGKPGTGKNHLASAIVNSIAKSFYSSLSIKAIRMMREIKSTWSRRSQKTEKEIIDLFDSTDLLVINEIGIQFDSKIEQDLFFDILDERYENMKPTIFTSNLSYTEVGEVLGERVIDRFLEGNNHVLVFDWESYREKVKHEKTQ